MNRLEFVAAMTGVAVWPLAIVVLVLVFRKPLSKVIERPLTRLAVPGVEATWEATLDAAREQSQESEQETQDVQTALEESPAASDKVNTAWELEKFGFDHALFQTANDGPPAVARISGMNELRQFMNEQLHELTGNVGGVDLREIARNAQAAGIIEVSLFESLLRIADLSDLLTHGAIREDAAKVVDLLKLIRNAHRQFYIQAFGFKILGPIPEREVVRSLLIAGVDEDPKLLPRVDNKAQA
jgi:hypothetical protein